MNLPHASSNPISLSLTLEEHLYTISQYPKLPITTGCTQLCDIPEISIPFLRMIHTSLVT